MGVEEAKALLKRWAPIIAICTAGGLFIKMDSNDGAIPFVADDSHHESRELRAADQAFMDFHLGDSAEAMQPLFFSGEKESSSRKLQQEKGAEYDKSAPTVALPAWTKNLKDIWEPITEEDTPFLWAVPRTGAIAVNDVFTYCLGLSMANHRGAYTGNKTVDVYKYGHDRGLPHQPSYVNVRTNTKAWIDECERRDLIGAQKADAFISPWLTPSAEQLFKTYKARSFVMMRNPVKRIIDEFYFHQHSTQRGDWDINKATLALNQYINSDLMVENLVTRTLLKKEEDFEITAADMKIAKEILRTKFIVGIHEWFDISVLRFERYFGFVKKYSVLTNLTINKCHYHSLRYAHHIGNHPYVPNSEQIHDVIYKRNWADFELYHYSKNLFGYQEKLLPGDEQ